MTPEIRIDWLTDQHNCETCGSSIASGARVSVGGVVAFELKPRAHCFDDASWEEWEVYHRLLQHLGYDVPAPDWTAQDTLAAAQEAGQ